MKILKTSLIFLVTFYVGNLSVFQTNSDLLQRNKLLIEPEKRQICLLNPSKKEPEIRTFKVEGFWDKLENEHNKHLLEIGEVSNGEDFKVKSGEIWLGLYVRDKDTKIVPTKIKVKRTDYSEMSWTVFSSNSKEKPLFLVKNLRKVKTGKVETLFSGLTWEDYDKGKGDISSLESGFVKEFKLGERIYKLYTEKGVDENQRQILVLILDDGTKSQIIYYIYYSGSGDHVGNLYWVGDLDTDGKLDLFMDFWNYEKGGYSSGLFLSSEAKKGNLVKLFDYFALGGC